MGGTRQPCTNEPRFHRIRSPLAMAEMKTHAEYLQPTRSSSETAAYLPILRPPIKMFSPAGPCGGNK